MAILDSPAHLAAILAGLGGIITGIVQWRKNKTDERLGVRSARREDDQAWDARYQAILDEVREHLVDPLKAEVAALRDEVAGLRTDLHEERARYRSALGHIRDWRLWGDLHVALTVDRPVPPERIREDI